MIISIIAIMITITIISIITTIRCRSWDVSGKDKGGPSKGGFLNNRIFP